MNSPDKPTFIIKTLGCKVNQYESQAMREELARNGLTETKDAQCADLCVINSCTVTGKADKETRNLARRFYKLNPSGKIVIAGCYAEADGDREALMRIPGVVALMRNSEKVSARITNFEGRNRAFVKVQDGCDHRCSYCKVSIVRGPSRSRPAGEVLEEVSTLVAKGFKEIVLTGVCLGAWGRDLKGFALAGLIKEISRISGLFRIRLSSIEPIYVTDELINALKENKLCKHLSIPLQSGDDRILKLMRRPYDTKRFSRLIKKIRKQIPDVAFTTDVLLGFPGEKEEHFRNTLKFIKEVRPSRIHVFPYSRREGTRAARLKPGPDKKAIKERVKILTGLGEELSADFAKGFMGKRELACIESERDRKTGLLTGYTDRYVRVYLEGPDSLKNRLVTVKMLIRGRLDNGVII